MLRVLHLLGHTPDFQTERGAHTLAQRCGADIQGTTFTIGRAGEFRDSIFAAFGLRRRLAGTFDIVHAWGAAALTAAYHSHAPRIVFTPNASDAQMPAAWRRRVERRPHLQIVCSSLAIHRKCIDLCLARARCHLIHPCINVAGIPSGRSLDRRVELGFAEHDYVILAAGESVRSAGHRTTIWAASILHVLDPRYKVLLWGRGADTPACARLVNTLRQPTLLTVAESRLKRRIEFEELLKAADIVLLAPEGPIHTLAAGLCLAAGLPMIAMNTPELADFPGSLLSGTGRAPRLLAQRVIEMRGNPAAHRAVAKANRDRAQKIFSRDDFIEQHRGIYLELSR